MSRSAAKLKIKRNQHYGNKIRCGNANMSYSHVSKSMVCVLIIAAEAHNHSHRLLMGLDEWFDTSTVLMEIVTTN